jgi:hypothetical protein
MQFQRLAYAFLFALLSGCASVQPVLAPTAAVDPGAGYVAGLFSRMKARGYAFVIRSFDGSAEYNMPLGEDSNWPTAVTDQSVVIKLPPGTYTVSQWITYATLTKEVMSRRPMSNPVLTQPFTVNAGSVTHLGSYDIFQHVQHSYPMTTTHMRLQARRATLSQVQEALAATYPHLAKLPVHCLLCLNAGGIAPTP